MKNSVVVAVWCLIAVMLVAQVKDAAAVNCSPLELNVCMRAITEASPASPECCAKLREQQPCFCGYINNPILRPYIDSPNAKKVAANCGIPAPRC